MHWLMLAGAIAAEIVATLSLRAAAGELRPGPTAITVLGYVVAFVLFAQVLRTLDVGPAYAVWAGVGTVGAAIGGWLLFDERVSAIAACGIALVAAGVVLISLGGATHA